MRGESGRRVTFGEAIRTAQRKGNWNKDGGIGPGKRRCLRGTILNSELELFGREQKTKGN